MKKKLKKGFCGIIEKIDEKNPAAKKLTNMGLTPDTHICVKHIAPLGDPIVIAVRNYKLAVRKRDLESIVFKD